MNKMLTVLAECVDSRNGNRFQPGDEFAPTPTEVQARRLFAAGCLPEGAIALAADSDAEAEAKRDKDAGLASAIARHAALESALSDAEAKLVTASDAEKADVQKLVDTAKADLEISAKELAKLKKK